MNNVESLIESIKIKDNKQWIRLYEKTQVASPQTNMNEILRNRGSHSVEVASSNLIVCYDISSQENLTMEEIDYNNSLYSAGLVHDIGMSPFGHDGADLISDIFKELGVEEGFDDNNNNLVTIKKNKVAVRDSVIAGIIKYPEKLYDDQKEEYKKILDAEIQKDIEHFNKLGIKLENRKRTICCDIMDESDRDCYVPSDLSDFVCSGKTFSKLQVLEFISGKRLSTKYYIELIGMLELSLSKDKTRVKEYFSDLKLRFNKNHKLTNKGLVPKDKELYNYREVLNSLCHEFYIKPIRKKVSHSSNMNKLASFISYVIEEEFYPSKHYSRLIVQENDEVKKNRLIRDMVSEVSDTYIAKMYKKLKLKNKVFKNSFVHLIKEY